VQMEDNQHTSITISILVTTLLVLTVHRIVICMLVMQVGI